MILFSVSAGARPGRVIVGKGYTSRNAAAWRRLPATLTDRQEALHVAVSSFTATFGDTNTRPPPNAPRPHGRESLPVPGPGRPDLLGTIDRTPAGRTVDSLVAHLSDRWRGYQRGNLKQKKGVI